MINGSSIATNIKQYNTNIDTHTLIVLISSLSFIVILFYELNVVISSNLTTDCIDDTLPLYIW